MFMENYTNGVIEGDIVKFILDRNAAQSEAFTDPSAQLKRRLYRAQHPTEILVLKCMDGRLNLSLYTETPPGILQPFRNIGGKFDYGWPFFQELIRDGVNFSVAKGRECLVITFRKATTIVAVPASATIPRQQKQKPSNCRSNSAKLLVVPAS